MPVKVHPCVCGSVCAGVCMPMCVCVCVCVRVSVHETKSACMSLHVCVCVWVNILTLFHHGEIRKCDFMRLSLCVGVL